MNRAMFEVHIHRAKRDLHAAMNEVGHSPSDESVLDCLEEIIAALEAMDANS